MLPEAVYGAEDVKRLATEEGWNRELVDPYRFLNTTYYKNTFFAYGKGPMTGVRPINSNLVIDLEPVSEEDPANLVLFGNRGNVSEMQALTWSELNQIFESYREFRNPFGGAYQTTFDDFCINKLVVLAKKPCIDQTISDRKKRLVATIDSIRLENEKKMQYLETIKHALRSSVTYREGFQVAMEALYKMAMAMRSFRENDIFSVDVDSGTLGPEETELAVSLSAIKLDNLLKEVDPWVRDTFLNLPLVIYYPKENKFSTSETNFEGHTIGGRLSIVHMGEHTNFISSCLRLSSNWFLSTVFYYQQVFSLPVRFDITRLKHIG